MAVNQINILQQENEAFANRIAELLLQIESLTTENSELRGRLDKFKASGIIDLVTRALDVEKRTNLSEAELKKANAELRSASKELQSLFNALQEEVVAQQGRIDELQRQRDELDRQIEASAREIERLSSQNGELREMISKQHARELAHLAHISEETEKRKQAEEQLKASHSRNVAHDATARAEAAEEQNLELQIQLEEEIKAKESLIEQLRQMQALIDNGGGRTVRKLAEHETKRAKKEKARADAAETRVEELSESLQLAWDNIGRLTRRIEEIEGKTWLEDIDIIFKQFGIDVGVRIDKGEREALYTAVYKAKKLDKKNKDKQKRAAGGFDEKVDQIVEAVRATRETESGKRAVTREVVMHLIDQTMSKPNLVQMLLKSPTAYKLKFAGITFAVLVVVAAAIAVPTGLKAHQSRIDAETAMDQVGIVYQLSEIDEIVGGMQSNYRTIQTNHGYSQALEERNGRNETNEASFTTIEDSYTAAGNILALNDSNEIAPDSAVGVAVAGYTNAVSSKDQDAAKKYYGEVKEYSDAVQVAAEESTTALSSILQGLGLTIEDIDLEGYQQYQEKKADFDQYMNMQASPVIDVEFSEDDVSAYSDQLIAKRSGYKGTATSVKKATYDKETGNVTILVECQDKKGRDYLNVITFQLDSGRTYLSVGALMGEAEERMGSDAIQTFSARAEDAITDAEGNVAYTFTSSSYDSKAGSTVVVAEVLVVKADGGVTSLSKKTVIQGKASDAVASESKTELINSVLADANKKLHTAYVTSVDDVENQ